MHRMTLSDPVYIPEKYREIVIAFLREYWHDLTWELRNQFGIELDISEHPHTDDDLLKLLVADAISEMARAAAGETKHLDKGIVYEGIQGLLERMFGIPGSASYQIPQEFWETDFGQVVALAFAWVQGDELITMSEASEISGKSLSSLSQLISRGKLKYYPDPNEPNPQRARRVLKSEVKALI